MQFKTILLQFLLFCQMLITHFLKRVLFVIILFFHPIFIIRIMCRASRQEATPIINKTKTASLALQLVNAVPPRAIISPSMAIPIYSVNLLHFFIFPSQINTIILYSRKFWNFHPIYRSKSSTK